MASARITSALPLEIDVNERYDPTHSHLLAQIERDAQPSGDVQGHYEHGRRYHTYKEGTYHMPNDANEQDRLDMQHRIFVTALDGRLYRAPLPPGDIGHVLDVGCGTGLWCMDVARNSPQAGIVGFDLR